MSELRDRLERLAGRGTPRGADAVLRAAQRTGPREVRVASDGAARDDHDLEIIDSDVPFVTAEPGRRRGRYSTLIAATGVAVLAGVGVLAVTAMFGSGGADSPEAAVRQLADAVAHRDPLAAVDVLAPSEVRTMHENVQHLTKRAAELKIIDQASDPLAGVDLSVDNLQLSSTDLADGYAKVTVTNGTMSAGVRRAALSKLLQDAMRNSDKPDPTGKVELARLAGDLPTFVITVRHDGNWYVSPVYTALEYLREANDGPPADFGSADVSKLGADTPQHAVEDSLRAVQAGDWNRLLELAPPDELPVYDYRAWINREASDARPDFTIDSLSTTADVSGDHGVVTLAASGTFGDSSRPDRWQVGGSCPSAGDYLRFGFSDSEQSDTGTGPSLCLAGDLEAAVPFGLLTYQPTPEQAASGSVSVQVVREGGRWYVSPIGTVLDAIDNFVQHVDERTIYPLIGLGYRLPTDATLTLNQPLRLAEATHFGQVLAFDGTAGQEVVGQNEGASTKYAYYVTGQLYSPDGEDLGYIDFQPKGRDTCCAYAQTLPTTGSYHIVLVDPLRSEMTLTLFDTDHAPKELLNDDYAGSGEECTYSGNTQVCTKFGEASGPLDDGSGLSGVTPTTAAGHASAVTDTTAVGKAREVTATTAP